MMIVVCPLNHAGLLVSRHGASHAVSLLAPGTAFPDFDGLGPDRHLRLSFHDIVQHTDGHRAPGAADAERLVSFLRGWPRDNPMLIHCWAGISRSTAAAYIALCMLRPQAAEADLAWELRDASPSATPNRLIVSLADRLLGRDGRMLRAIDAIGRGAEAFEGTPFVLKP